MTDALLSIDFWVFVGAITLVLIYWRLGDIKDAIEK